MFKDLFRKKGHWKGAKVKWVQKGTGIELELKYRCSRCGLFNLWDTPYCPNCGAKMDESTMGQVKPRGRERKEDGNKPKSI